MTKLKVHYKIGNKEFVRVENIHLSVLLSHCGVVLISENLNYFYYLKFGIKSDLMTCCMKKNTQNDYMIQSLVIITRNVKITKNSKTLHTLLEKSCFDARN